MSLGRFVHLEEGLSSGGYNNNKRNDEKDSSDCQRSTLKEFRQPRNILLCVVSIFTEYASTRLRELKNLANGGYSLKRRVSISQFTSSPSP